MSDSQPAPVDDDSHQAPSPGWRSPAPAAARPTGDTEPDVSGSAHDPVDPAGVDVEELLTLVEELTTERDSHLRDLQRITAEYANFRRQASKRQSDMVEHAASGLAEKLLPVLDACESALLQGATDVEPIRGALLDVLQREGLEIVADESAPFDPERHEAVAHEPGDGEPEQTVAEVMRSGYAWRGKVLRPAMVRVRG